VLVAWSIRGDLRSGRGAWFKGWTKTYYVDRATNSVGFWAQLDLAGVVAICALAFVVVD